MWSDIDFDNKIISIDRAMYYAPQKVIYFEMPKTTSSVRKIAVSETVLDLLREYKAWQDEKKSECGDKWENHELIFTGWNGKPEQPSRIGSRFRAFMKHNDLPHISLHSLRHTNTTLLIAAGIDSKTVSLRLDHAKLSTTIDIYTQVIESINAKTTETLDTFLS